ncbi:unnamed protein product [Closterium sp. NIES-65]|nr:unnamed protein product [Closterium sp. NIES-65]
MQNTLELPEDQRRQHAERILGAERGEMVGGRRGERVLLDTGVKLGMSAPPLSSGPSMAVVNMSFYRWESVAAPPVVDWRKTVAITPIQTQFVVGTPLAPRSPGYVTATMPAQPPSSLLNFPPTPSQCSSCWAIAAVDSIAIMWAIANNGVGTNLSPQQVCDCATKQCCQGGWPEWAFSYVLFNGGITSNANYPYLAYDSATCLLDTSMSSVAQITGWELVPAFNAMALMKAVSMQPVVAFISASAADFTAYSSNGVLNIYNGLCTTDVNHAVVVVGFNYTGPDLKGSYWIIKNSWYATWGDRGYMYLAMTPDVRGKCGILSPPILLSSCHPSFPRRTPAMYPVYFPSGQQPARFASDKRGKWKINKVDDLSSSLFSSTLSLSTTSISTTTTTTTSSTDFSSSTDFAIAAITDPTISDSSSLLIGSTTDSSATKTTTLSTTCVGMINPCGGGSCYISGGIPRCNCSAMANMVEVLGVPTSKCVPRSPCTTASVNPCGGGTCTDVGDGTYTCACSAGYAIGAAVDGSPTCLPAAGLAKSYVTSPGDNCTFVATAFGISTTTLTNLNTFINCSATEYLPPGIALTTTINCTGRYRVMQGDTCPSIWNAANLTMSMFQAINPGIQCQAPYLVVGQQVCIDSPILTTMQRNPNANYSIYTVRANDTLSTISSLYLPRCTKLSVTPAAIAAQNYLTNLSAPLPIGMNLIIPCMGGIGMIDGGCATSLTVCGSDFVSYPSYCHAAVNYALPVFQYSPCDKCGAACPGRMGLTPLTGFGCTQAVCPYPAWGACGGRRICFVAACMAVGICVHGVLGCMGC